MKNKIHFILLIHVLLVHTNYCQSNGLNNLPDSITQSYRVVEEFPEIVSINLTTENNVKIVVIHIAIKDHPTNTDKWPVIQNPEDFPNETNPLLGTLPDGSLLRNHLGKQNSKSMPVEDWYKPQIEEYLKLNSNGKFSVEVEFPQMPNGNMYSTNTSYSEFVEFNQGNKEGMVSKYNNWKKMADEVLEKIDENQPELLKEVKLLNLIYSVTNSEYSDNEYSAFSPDSKFYFYSSTNKLLYYGYVTTSNSLNPTLHEIFHRIGSMAGSPNDFEGLPDRTTIEFLDLPKNMTWGYDIMCNKGQIPSENALYGVPPMLTMDRIFLGWIEPDEVVTINFENINKVKLRDVNMSLTNEQIENKFFRAAKVMIHPKYDGVHDEYFLMEYRAGTGFDRNFYNIYEQEPHKGILIWHIKERTKILNRRRSDDNFIDLEVAVPYNGWYGNPIPYDDFPRNYQRPAEWRNEVNAAGDYDYLDDSASLPYLPDGGVHRWELTDTSHVDWKPYYLRRNTLKSNFFTDESVRGIVTNKLTNETHPSSKDWDGKLTDISIYNIKHVDDYMTFDVSYSGGVLDVENDVDEVSDFSLIGNYPNPFNPSTTIKYQVPAADALSPAEVPVLLKVYDMLGSEVTTLVNETQPAGSYEVKFDGARLSSGIYIYRLSSGNYSNVKKMTLLK